MCVLVKSEGSEWAEESGILIKCSVRSMTAGLFHEQADEVRDNSHA